MLNCIGIGFRSNHDSGYAAQRWIKFILNAIQLLGKFQVFGAISTSFDIVPLLFGKLFLKTLFGECQWVFVLDRNISAEDEVNGSDTVDFGQRQLVVELVQNTG